MIENFDEIVLDYELTLLKLTETTIQCLYDSYHLEIQAEKLYIKTLSMDRLHLQVHNLQRFQILRRDPNQ